MYVYAHLDQSKLDTLRDFEQRNGITLLAFSEVKAQPAPMDDAALEILRTLEDRLGVTLVAYR